MIRKVLVACSCCELGKLPPTISIGSGIVDSSYLWIPSVLEESSVRIWRDHLLTSRDLLISRILGFKFCYHRLFFASGVSCHWVLKKFSLNAVVVFCTAISFLFFIVITVALITIRVRGGATLKASVRISFKVAPTRHVMHHWLAHVVRQRFVGKMFPSRRKDAALKTSKD